MRLHRLQPERRVLVPAYLFVLLLTGMSFQATGATTRLAAMAAHPRARVADTSLRRGGAPIGVRLTAGSNGEFYGAGALSGDSLSQFGSVVRIDPSGEVWVLHDFAGSDGARPAGTTLLASDGFVYGVTADGGASQAGTIYRVRPDGTGFATVYSFTGGADGRRPLAGLVETRTGALVGTASEGGANGRGVIFQIDTSGAFSTLHQFTQTEGSAPAAALMDPGTGLLYGTTQLGGAADGGTVFGLRPNGSAFRTIHRFTGDEGFAPQTDLVRGRDGLLYGTTSWGGLWNNGTLYRIAADGTRFERVRGFTAAQRDTSLLTDKSRPQSLAVGPDGRIYGTTVTSVEHVRGEAYAVRTDTAEYSVLYGYDASGDPRGGLVRGQSGALYVPVFDVSAGVSAAVMHLQPVDGSAKAATVAPAAATQLGVGAGPTQDVTTSPQGTVACANPWVAATPYPELIGRYAFAQNGEDLYVISGVDNGSIVATMNRYNAGTNAWTSLAAVPIPGEASSASFLAGKIYFAQGSGGAGFAIYDVAGNTWSAGPAVPGNTDHYGAAQGAFNGNVFVVGGGTAGPSTTVEVYNIAGNSWSAGTSAPSGYQLGGYVQVGQFLYCVGSFGASPASNSTVSMRLDMSSAPGVWTTGPTWTPQRADFGLAFQAGTLYALGGDAPAGGFFDATATVNSLDTSAWPGGTWVASPPDLPAIRQANQAGFNATVGRAGGEIWSTGGIFGRNVHTFLSDHLYRPNGADVTPPVITCPGNIITTNMVVTFNVTATDNCSTPTVVCAPASGSTFPLGTTTVTCTATDASQNASMCSFTVTVVTSTFTNCCVDDATGNVLSIDANPLSGGYGNWQLLIVGTGQTLSGNAESISNIPGHSLIAHDHDSATVAMDMYINYGAHTCTATVTDLTTGTRYVIRDRNINNNPPCTGAPPPPA